MAGPHFLFCSFPGSGCLILCRSFHYGGICRSRATRSFTCCFCFSYVYDGGQCRFLFCPALRSGVTGGRLSPCGRPFFFGRSAFRSDGFSFPCGHCHDDGFRQAAAVAPLSDFVRSGPGGRRFDSSRILVARVPAGRCCSLGCCCSLHG
jgi:hypothetical protein